MRNFLAGVIVRQDGELAMKRRVMTIVFSWGVMQPVSNPEKPKRARTRARRVQMRFPRLLEPWRPGLDEEAGHGRGSGTWTRKRDRSAKSGNFSACPYCQ